MSNVQDLLKTIPPCIRCRRNHRGCDVQLPRCNNCVKAGLDECLYYDNILDTHVSRHRVASLAKRYAEVQAKSKSRIDTAEAAAHESVVTAGNTGVFFGNHACAAGHLDQHLERVASALPPDDVLSQLSGHSPLGIDVQAQFVQRYFSPVNRMYPILDPGHPVLTDPTCVDADDPSAIFISNIVLAIACRAVPEAYRHADSLLSLAERSYKRAMEHVEEATGDVSVAALRNMALLSVHALFAPHCGNLHQLVGVAVRLCVDLSIQKKRDPFLRRLFLSVLCVERQAGLCFDRPWSLLSPETAPYDQTEPVELLWGILSLACHYRQSLYDNISLSVSEALNSLKPYWDTISLLNPPLPNLVAELNHVQLALVIDGQCSSQVQETHAIDLLKSYELIPCFHTFLTGQWIFKACETLLDRSRRNANPCSSVQYQRALILLDRDSAIWPSCRALVETLQGLAT